MCDSLHNGGNHVIFPRKACRSEGNDFGSNFRNCILAICYIPGKIQVKCRICNNNLILVMFFTAIETGIFSVLIGKFRVAGSLQELLAEICLAFFSTVIALVLFQKGTFLCGAVMASLLSTFEPLTGVVIGWIVFKEKMTLKLGIGILLILFSTVLVALPVKEKKRI